MQAMPFSSSFLWNPLGHTVHAVTFSLSLNIPGPQSTQTLSLFRYLPIVQAFSDSQNVEPGSFAAEQGKQLGDATLYE